MLRNSLATAVCLLGLFAISAQADTVKMKDGRTFTGSVIKDDETGFTIDAMVHGIRGKISLSKSEIESVIKEPLPPGFFDGRKPQDQNAPTTQSSSKPAVLDAESQARVDKLKSEVVSLGKDKADYEKQLRKAPKTVRKVYRTSGGFGPGVGEPYGGGSKWQPLDSVAVNEPNPAIPTLKAKIKKAATDIAAKNNEIADLVNNPDHRAAILNESKMAEENRAQILAELRKRFGDPTATADQAVAVLFGSKAIEEPATSLGIEAINPRKALLYKAMILNMSTAADDWNLVSNAQPDMIFKSVNYKFKFVTKAGLIRVNQGYVLLCKIDGVWWPLQINIDGLGAYWSAYEHPLVTPSLMQSVVKAYREQDKQQGQLNIGGLKKSVMVKVEFSPGQEKQTTIDLGKKVTMKLVLIPEGKFTMGSVKDENGRSDDEGPPREVTVSKAFYVGVYPVTQEQYEQVMGKNPSKFKGARNPVEQLSWDDALEFCKELSKKTGRKFSLPTEAQWEYACRAGGSTRFYYGDDNDYAKLGNHAWYAKNSDSKTHEVGQKSPNAWGLYDMHGNVWQWCSDWYDKNYYRNGVKADPSGPASGTDRVLRGGCWCDPEKNCRSASRGKHVPGGRFEGFGVRVIMVTN